MISVWHLLWIVPLSGVMGIFCLAIVSDRKTWAERVDSPKAYDVIMTDSEYKQNRSFLPEAEPVFREGKYVFFRFESEKERKMYMNQAKKFVTFVAPVSYDEEAPDE